ncbi:MAG: 16S rRNA processing protein RimM [Clostridia bacterium]|nr:16S rRNA processing protein RimM [Clostridia bacterium]
MEKLQVFEIVKPQGIKGELKARILADDFFSVNKIKKLFDENGTEYLVKNVKNAFSGFAFLTLNGVDTRNVAELFRAKIFYALKTDIKKGKNSYFISDLKGLKVIIGEEIFGEIVDVLQSNVDMFKMRLNNGKIAYFPFLKSLNPVIDIEKQTLLVNEEKLSEVIYYEN